MSALQALSGYGGQGESDSDSSRPPSPSPPSASTKGNTVQITDPPNESGQNVHTGTDAGPGKAHVEIEVATEGTPCVREATNGSDGVGVGAGKAGEPSQPSNSMSPSKQGTNERSMVPSCSWDAETDIDPSIQAKIESFHAKVSSGLDFVQHLKARKVFHNPALLHQLITKYNVSPHGTRYPPSLFTLDRYNDEDKGDKIIAAMSQAGSRASSRKKAAEVPRAAGRRSKWDQPAVGGAVPVAATNRNAAASSSMAASAAPGLPQSQQRR